MVTLPALSPLLAAEPTCGYDNVFHLWRAVQVDHLWQHGVPISRWAPDMAHGFGLPLFVFVSPLSACVAAALRNMGLSWPLALNATFALGMVLGGLFTFLLGRDLFGPRAGLVATAAYVYSPFQAYEVFNRGSLWEAFAWVFPPLVLWGLNRWVTGKDRRFLLAGAFGLAVLILTHQLFAVLYTPLFAAWVVAVTVATRDPRALARGAACGLLGLGMSAFYWIPGLAERGLVQTDRLLGTWVFDYTNNFLPPRELLALPRVADPALVNDWPPKAMGAVPALLALIPLVTWRRLSRRARWQVAALVAALVTYVFLTLRCSLPLWDRVPLLEYVQFPWRFLGPAALCTALLAAAGARALADAAPVRGHWPRLLVPGLLVGLLWATSLGWFFPRSCALPRDTSPSGMIAWERATDTIGSTAKGEYLPVWVRAFPESVELSDAYESRGAIPRLEAGSLPDGAVIQSASYGATCATIDLFAPGPFTARYLAFYYPGWRVAIDDEAAALEPTDPHGLISFDVPAGTHRIDVSFGSTPVRRVGFAISGLSAGALLAFVGLASIATHSQRSPADPGVATARLPSDRSAAEPPRSLLSHAWGMLALSVLILIVRVAILDGLGARLRQTRLVGGRLVGVDVPVDIRIGDDFVLLGYDTLPARVPSGERFEVTTYWRATEPGGPDVGVRVDVVDAKGRRWSGDDLRSPRWHRTPPPAGEWARDEYASVAVSVPLLVGTPPGQYRVEIVAFDRDTLLPLTAVRADRSAIGPAVEMGTLQVVNPGWPQRIRAASHVETEVASMGPLTLVDAHLDRTEAAPGGQVLASVLWLAGESPQQDFTLALALRRPDDSVAAAFSVPPAVDWHPTSTWRRGDLWLGLHHLRIPAVLEAGEYRVDLQVCAADGSACTPVGAAVDIGTLSISAPRRAFEPPALDVVADVQLGGVATLLGALVSSQAESIEPGATLTVTLVWRADAMMDRSYRVYLHLLGSDGRPIAQSDGEPAVWTRPTTGWIADEIVLDERTIRVPEDAASGEALLRAGLYTREGGRLLTDAGDDGVTLTSLKVGDEP